MCDSHSISTTSTAGSLVNITSYLNTSFCYACNTMSLGSHFIIFYNFKMCIRNIYNCCTVCAMFILKYNAFPLAAIIRDMLQMGEREMRCPVEIEFAVNMDVPLLVEGAYASNWYDLK